VTAIATSYTEQLTGKARISYEEFLTLSEDVRAEWVEGEVVRMPSVGRAHQEVGRFLIALFQVFLDERPLGGLYYDPFQLRLPGARAGRAPDLMVLLHEHEDRLRDLHIEGPADLVLEIVSPSGASRDYVEKFREYEAGGVPEYWIVDPENRETSLFRLRDGRYERAAPDADDTLRSEVLPGFRIHPDWPWERPKVNGLVAAMLGS
jgi:Uma2 family endonuclease